MGLGTKNVRYAHSDGHTDVCYGSNNEHIITCGSDGNVRIWNGADDDDPSADSVAEMALSVICGRDQFFVATDSNYVQAFKYPQRESNKIVFRFSAPVTHIALSSSGKYMAAGSCDMVIQVLNTETNKLTAITGHKGPILGVSLDPLDEYVVSSSCDGSVKIWNITTGSLVKTYSDCWPVKNDFFKSISLGRTAWKSVSGSLLAIPKYLEVFVYKRSSWELSYKLSSNNIEQPLSVVLFSPCGNYAAAASTGGEIVIWEIKYKSEVCCYKEPRKVGISGIAWHPDGSEIVFTDRLGRLAVLTGINEEISKHVAPKDNAVEVLAADKHETNSELDANSFLPDCEEEEEEENCISLDKIKAPYKIDSDDEEIPGSPGSAATNTTTMEPMVSLTKPQPPFQPSSTPPHFEPRCLCYNSIGFVRYYESDRTVDVQFHDTMFHHSLFLRSFGVCTMAALSVNVLCLAVPSIEDNPSKLTCVPLSSWAGTKEWTIHMPPKENIISLAAGESWVAVATNANHMRVFTHAGTQKQVVSLPGPVVCMAGHEQKILVVCHMGVGLLDNQNEGFVIYQISNLSLRTVTPFQTLPLSPKSVLKWAGFTDEGTPSIYDSEGVLRLLGHDLAHWEVACDTSNQRKSSSDRFFLIGLSERYQNFRCIICKNSFYPLIINNPTVVELPLKIPLCAPDSEKSLLEEAFWRLMFSLQSLECCADKNEYQGEISSFEQTLKQTALKLFAEACRNSEDLRALDVATFMSSHPLEVAAKYASKVGKIYLAEKLNGITPVDWHRQHLEKCMRSLPETDYADNTLYSQQDLFEEYPVILENENKLSDNSVEQPESPEALKQPSFNPFKRPQVQKSEGPKGLRFFDTLIKETPKQSKSQFQSKPLKLKSSNTRKEAESKTKKPSFVQWFSTRKTSLSEEYPTASPRELTKLGLKIYKEELNSMGNDKKLNESESKKRESEEGIEPVSKRSKNSDSSM